MHVSNNVSYLTQGMNACTELFWNVNVALACVFLIFPYHVSVFIPCPKIELFPSLSLSLLRIRFSSTHHMTEKPVKSDFDHEMKMKRN